MGLKKSKGIIGHYRTSDGQFSNKVSQSRKIGIQVMNQPNMGFAMVKSAHSLSPKSQVSKVVRVGGKIFRIKELG